ncbi:MAG: hypothetical protein H6901_06845 [Rhodobacteraceae bacterium]|nr:hypothetical protein [Paracoccaceae bacterium]MCP5341916.1 hypothetical protein [Paracoccaceae bacterium]
MKPILASALFAALMMPASVFAQGCHHDARQAQISCAEGQSWDASTRTCVTVGS